MEGEKQALAEVTGVITRTGPGGGCHYITVKLLDSNRTLTRVVEGPIRVGDMLYLLETDRDQKVGRR